MFLHEKVTTIEGIFNLDVDGDDETSQMLAAKRKNLGIDGDVFSAFDALFGPGSLFHGMDIIGHMGTDIHKM